MKKTYFKDRRTLAVYVTTEETGPASGSIPLKPAYREDTVWIDQSNLERTQDPHEMTRGQAFLFLFLLLAWVALFVTSSYQTAHTLDISFAEALFYTAGWSAIGFSCTVRLVGLVHR